MKMNQIIRPMRLTSALFSIIIAFSAFSCKTSGQAGAKSTPQYARVAPAEIDYRAGFAALASTYNQWEDVKMPVNIKLTSPASMSLSGTVTMTAAKTINISLRMLGFEVASLYVDNDSVFAIYKVQKRYVAESIPQLLKNFPATVGNLQSLLLGRIFYPGLDTPYDINASMFEYSAAGDTDLPDAVVMTPMIDTAGIECAFIADGQVVPSVLAFMAIVSNHQASAIYSTPQLTPAGAVSPSCDINGSLGGKNIAARISWNLDKAQWNTGATAKRPNTRGYTRISASSLLKTLSSL